MRRNASEIAYQNPFRLSWGKGEIGPPGSGGVLTAKAMSKALDIADKVKLVNVSFEGGAQSMKDGQIDVSITPEALTYRLPLPDR